MFERRLAYPVRVMISAVSAKQFFLSLLKSCIAIAHKFKSDLYLKFNAHFVAMCSLMISFFHVIFSCDIIPCEAIAVIQLIMCQVLDGKILSFIAALLKVYIPMKPIVLTQSALW